MTEYRLAEPSGGDWGWDARERAQRERLARTSLAAKIASLEDVHRLVIFLVQQRSERADETKG
jgi:hypothetical protein